MDVVAGAVGAMVMASRAMTLTLKTHCKRQASHWATSRQVTPPIISSKIPVMNPPMDAV